MPRLAIELLPDTSRLFVYHTERALEASQESHLRKALESFLESWAAHGSALTVGYEIRHHQFIIVAVDDSAVGPSGCSIDASTQFLREYSRSAGVEILNAPEICYLDGQHFRCANRGDFGQLVNAGRVTVETIVVDETIPTLGDLRRGRLEVPAGESWHALAWRMRQIA